MLATLSIEKVYYIHFLYYCWFFKNLLKISIGNFQGNFSGLWMNTISFFNILNVTAKICWLFASLSHIISIYNLLDILIARHLASYFVELFQLLSPHNNSNKRSLLALFYRKKKISSKVICQIVRCISKAKTLETTMISFMFLPCRWAHSIDDL